MNYVFLSSESVLHTSLSLDELVEPFKDPTMEGKSLVLLVALELIEWCYSVKAYFKLIKLLSLLLCFTNKRPVCVNCSCLTLQEL